MLLALWPLAGQQQQATTTKPARLTGVVTNSITGEPVRKVQVRLQSDAGPGRNGMPGRSAATTTDAQGKFTFDGVEPATYRLSAQKPGFLTMQYGARRGSSRGAPVKLDAGQETRVEFKILPQGVISGRIVDEDGDPVANAVVSVRRITASVKTQEDGIADNTDDRGEFRIANLPSGRYQVMARTSRRPFGERLNVTRPEQETDYAPTYFPGSLDAGGAGLIDVSPGKEVSGVQFSLLKTAVFKVRGRVFAAGAVPQNMTVSLSTGGRGPVFGGRFGGGPGGGFGPPGLGGGGMGARVKPDGSFEIPQVRPGSYTLVAMAMERRGGARSFGRTPLEVSRDVDNVTVTLNPPVTIEGAVKIDGQTTTSITSGQVFLRSLESSGPGSSTGRVQDDGTFHIENLAPEKYAVMPLGIPTDLYLSSVLLGTQAITGELDLSNAAAGVPLSLVFRPNAAVVEGTVKERDAPAQGVQVTLVPEPMGPADTYRVRQATTDADGHFSVAGVAPGDYRLYALSEPVQAMDLDAAFLKSYESKSVKLSLKEGSHEQKDLELIDLDPERVPQ